MAAGWSAGEHDNKTFTVVSENGNKAVFSKADSKNGGWAPDNAKLMLNVVDKQTTGKTLDFTTKGNIPGEFAHVPLNNPDVISIGDKGAWDRLIQSRDEVARAAFSDKANDPKELSLAMRTYDARFAKVTDWSTQEKYGDKFVSPVGVTKAILTHEIAHSDYLTSDKSIGDVYQAVSNATGVSTDALAKAEADGYRAMGSQKDVFGNTAMTVGANSVRMEGVSYNKDEAFSKWGLAPLPTDVRQALSAAGMTRYGTNNLAEATAEAYAMYQNTNIAPTPIVSELANSLGWERPVSAKKSVEADLTKAGAHELPGYNRRKAIEDKHRSAIKKALESVNGIRRAVQKATQTPANDPAHQQEIIARAVEDNVSYDASELLDAIQVASEDAVAAGAERASEDMSIDEAAQGGRVATLYDSLKTLAETIMQNSLAKATASIGAGIRAGMTDDEIVQRVMDSVASEDRADLIIVTQVADAENASFLDQLGFAGYSTYEWLAYEGACEYCEDNSGEHDIDDTDAWDNRHPNCRCVQVLPENANNLEAANTASETDQ